MRQLVILRHAVAEEKGGGQRDYDRELTPRGRKDAAIMGRWLLRQDLVPDHVVTSPAPRALQTALGACEAMGIAARDVHQDAALYDIGALGLLHRLAALPATARRVLLVGHNPGLEALAVHLTGDAGLEGDGLAKAGIVVADLPDDWRELGARSGRNVRRADPGTLTGA